MADISQQINAINSARYGEEVRGSIVTALTAVNNQVEDDTTSAGASATAAAASATEAAATEARLASAVAAAEQTEEDIEAAEALRVTAEQGRVTAENARVTAEAARADAATNYVAQAQAAAAQAQQYASSDYVKTAQSWAIGGTSSRYGEDTNNAKYWAEIAAEVVTEGGVGSFNGRMGQVSPEAGDYDTTMITRGTGSAESALAAIEAGIGTTTLPTTAQTLTGAIAEHESDIVAINGGNVVSNGIAMGDASAFSRNFLVIDLNGGSTSSVNRRASFSWTSANKSSYSNIPTELTNEDTAVGVREVYWIDSTHVIVMVHEAYPQLGRTHYIYYSGGSWGAWYTVLPSNGTVETLGVESGWTATQSWCKKRAGVVEFYLEITGGTLSSGWNTVGTLPSGYRPGIVFDMLGFDNGASSPANGVQTKVTTAGLIQVYKLSATTNNLRLHGTFLT